MNELKNDDAVISDLALREFCIAFSLYRERFLQERSRWFKKACEKAGGIFSLAAHNENELFKDFVNRKPIKSELHDGNWIYDKNYKETFSHSLPPSNEIK